MCPTPESLKAGFEPKIAAALNAIKFPKDVATWEYEDKVATVKVLKPETSVTSLSGTGAIVELEKLIKNEGLVSYTMGTKKRDLVGASQQNLKEWIVEDFTREGKINGTLKLGNLVGKEFEATVEFKSTEENCDVKATDTYKVKFEGEALVCPTEDEIKDEFETALTAALKNFDLKDKASYKFDKKVATVTILDSEQSVADFTGTNAIKELIKLVKNNGLVSYKMGETTRNLKETYDNLADDGKFYQKVKEWIVEDFAREGDLDATSLKLGQLVGKEFSAEIEIQSTKEGCDAKTTDTYTVKFEAEEANNKPSAKVVELIEQMANKGAVVQLSGKLGDKDVTPEDVKAAYINDAEARFNNTERAENSIMVIGGNEDITKLVIELSDGTKINVDLNINN